MNDQEPQRNLSVIAAVLTAFALVAALILFLVNPAYSQQPQNQTGILNVTPKMAAMTVRQRCANCHAIKPGVKTFAPPLLGLIGRKAGSFEGFSYSQKIKGLDLIWTTAAVDDWLAGTTFKTPDIRMRHVGITQPALRKAVVEYISTLREQSP